MLIYSFVEAFAALRGKIQKYICSKSNFESILGNATSVVNVLLYAKMKLWASNLAGTLARGEYPCFQEMKKKMKLSFTHYSKTTTDTTIRTYACILSIIACYSSGPHNVIEYRHLLSSVMLYFPFFPFLK